MMMTFKQVVPQQSVLEKSPPVLIPMESKCMELQA